MITTNNNTPFDNAIGMNSSIQFSSLFIVGKNDILVSLHTEDKSYRVLSIDNIYDIAVESSAIVAASSEQSSNDIMKTPPDEDVLLYFKRYYHDAIVYLVSKGYGTFAKYLLNCTLKLVQKEDFTLAIGYNKIEKKTILYISPIFIAKTVANDVRSIMSAGMGEMTKKVAISSIIAYFLCHECMHLFQGHLTTDKSYSPRFDNLAMDLSINSQISNSFYDTTSSRIAVDGGIIYPLYYFGDISFSNYEGFDSKGYTYRGTSYRSTSLPIPTNPCIFIVHSDQSPDVTKYISRLVDLKDQFTMKGSISTLKSSSQEKETPKPDPSLPILNIGDVVLSKSTRKNGVVTSISPLNVLYEDTMSPDQKILLDNSLKTVSSTPTPITINTALLNDTSKSSIEDITNVTPLYTSPPKIDLPPQPPQQSQSPVVGNLVKIKKSGTVGVVVSVSEIDGETVLDIEPIPDNRLSDIYKIAADNDGMVPLDEINKENS